MRAFARSGCTVEEYLALERQSGVRHEFLAGEVFAMGGASEAHNLIVGNLVREIGLQLKARPCKLYSNDMRVRVAPSGLYTYPDVAIVCGEVCFEDAKRDTLLNPTAIIEVLSPSTESYDRGEKFEHYRRLDSLEEYLLVSQHRVHVDHYTRQPDGRWLVGEWTESVSRLVLGSIACEVPLAEVYAKVDLSA